MKALTTLEALKIALRLDPNEESTDDDALNQIIAGVSQAVRNRTNRELNWAERTEFHDGTGSEWIYLKQRPVTAVAGVWLDGNGFYGQAPNGFLDPDTLMTPGVQYYVENFEQNEHNPSRLVLITNPWAFGILNQVSPIGEVIHAQWPRGRGNIKVTYSAGYRDMPDDLEMAIHSLCTIARNAAAKGLPMKSETIGRYSYELLGGADISAGGADIVTARAIISKYTECAF